MLGEVAYTAYMEILHQVLCIPRKVLPSRKNLPWISHSIITAMKRRNRLYKKYKSSGSQTALKNYKYTRNKITSELRKAKQGFFNKMNNANSKSFWKLYKTITKQKASIPCLKSPTAGLVTDSYQKANLLNSEFFKYFNHSRTPLFELASLGKDSSFIPDELLCSNEEIELYLRALDTKEAAARS